MPAHRAPRLPIAPFFAHYQGSLNGLGKHVAKTVHRARREGGFTYEAADKLSCTVLGLHPSLVWGDEWWASDLG